VLENLPWTELVRRYDHDGALFYLDPPYYGTERYYGRDLFPREEFDVMREALDGLKGKFILSINDCPETRSLFGHHHVVERQVTYSVSKSGSKDARELIVTNAPEAAP
ncbi:MAG: DNA adenine methylase, partial [Pseudomonadota bacterium]